MKKILLLLIVLYIYLFSSNSFADACFTTPNQVNEYMQTVNDVVNSIPRSSYEDENVWWDAITRFWQWASEVTWQIVQWTYVGAVIMSKITKQAVPGWDFFANMNIISNSEAAIRDWNQLINLERHISDVALQAWYAWVLNNTVDQGTLESIRSSIEWLDIVDSVSWFGDAPTYWDLVLFLWNFHAFYKEVYLNAVWHPIDRDLEAAANDFFAGNRLRVSSVNRWAIDEINQEYENATGAGNVCEDSYSDQFMENIESITLNAMNVWGDSIQRFSDSYALLKEVLNDVSPSWETSQEYDERKQELLRRHYWTELADELSSYEWAWWVWMMRDSLKENVVSPMRDLSYRIEEVSSTWERNQEIDRKEDTRSVTRSQSDSASQDSFRRDMKQTFDSVLDMQWESFADSTLEDPRGITMLFPELSKKVYSSYNTVGEMWEADTIIYNLWNACEYQCTNHWDPSSDCWYDNL